VDTCVWVAALRSRRGASFAILSEVPHGRFHFGISVSLFAEYRSKLLELATGARRCVTRRHADAILGALAHYGIEVPVFYRLRPNLRDENDNMVFECAANFGAEAIVTHNVRDFSAPELRGYDLAVLTPAAFLERIRRMP